MNTQQQQRSPFIDFVTDPGRLVSGDIAKASDKGYQNVKLPEPVFFFCIAVPKQSPKIPELFWRFNQHALACYARAQNIQQAIQAFPIGSMPPAGYDRGPFSWKIDDGDHPSERDKEGRAGCWLIKFKTKYPFDVLGANKQQINPASVHLGVWVQVAGRMSINDKFDGTCGISLYPSYVWVVGDGQRITNQPSAEQLFGNAAPQLPPGVTPYSGAPAPVAQPGAYGANPYQPQQGHYGAPPAAPSPNYTPTPGGAAYGAHPAPYQPAYAPPAGQPAPTAYPPNGGYAAAPQSPSNQPMPQGAYAPNPAYAGPPPASVPGAPAYGTAAPAPGYGTPPSPGTAYPSNQPVGNGYPAPAAGAPNTTYSNAGAPPPTVNQGAPYQPPQGIPPGVQPHPAFVNGPQR